ncbi:leupaxin-like [Anneissia japonica]|uniref:leupaxin-like n=1 Tax=Anneissia japonica TaxID=1529436 RepID=UPI001425B999|nr:leupaxin-like [Anneissia japonica]
MEDLDKLLEELQNTSSQLSSGRPSSTSQAAPVPPSPISPLYLEIPNGNQVPRKPQRQDIPENHFNSKPQQFSQPSPLYSEVQLDFKPSHSSTPPPKPAYKGEAVNNFANSTYQPTSNMSALSNLSELDSLLEDLAAAQIGTVKPVPTKPAPPQTAPKPKKPSQTDNIFTEIDASTRTNGQRSQPYQGGVTQSPSYNQHAPSPTQNKPSYTQNAPSPLQQQSALKSPPVISSPPPRSASSATKELDDLMESLSDFKMNHIPQVVDTKAHDPMKTAPVSQQASIEHNPSNQLDSMLRHLDSDMSRQGVNTVAKGHCAACNKPIVGQVVTALGKTFHPEHFTCSHCHQELGSCNFFERDGVAFCERDYHNLFSPRCGYCNGPILDKCVTALDKTWHPEHFFCAQCGRAFGDDGFHEKNGKAYCREDYFDMFAPKCGGCHRAIMENYMTALNAQWHPECFVCGECRMPFNGGSFFDHDGIPYCETHYHAVRGSLCAGCKMPVTGRCITAMGKKFHPEHFSCAYCLKQLNKGTFKEQNDKPYCHACFTKLFS